MNLLKLLKSKIFILLVIFTVIYIIFAREFHQYQDIWWDAASYIGVGKYLVTGGQQGVFEVMRPLFLPAVLGVFFKLGLEIVFFGKLFIFLMSLIGILFVYLTAKELFNEKIGLLSAIILAFNVLFFVFIFRIYTEILSVTFIMGAIYFIILFSKKENNWLLVLSALMTAFAFYTKYPNIILVGALDLFLLIYCYRKKQLRPLIWFNASLFAFLIPFFVINYYMGNGDILYLWHLSQNYYKTNIGQTFGLGCFPGLPKVFIVSDWAVYFKTVLYLFNILFPFAILGIFYSIKNHFKDSRKMVLLLLPMLIFFVFFEIFYQKQERYLIPVFPMLAIFAAYGIHKLGEKRKAFLWIGYSAVLIYVVCSLAYSGIFLNNSYHGDYGYREFFYQPPISVSCEKVMTPDPRSVLKYDKISPYYEVYDANWNENLMIREKPDCIFYFSCYSERGEQIERIEALNYHNLFERDTGRCTYAIFKL